MARLTNQNFKVIGSAFLIKIRINTQINKVNCYLLLKAFRCLSQQAQSQQNWYNYVMNSFELRKIPNNCLKQKPSHFVIYCLKWKKKCLSSKFVYNVHLN